MEKLIELIEALESSENATVQMLDAWVSHMKYLVIEHSTNQEWEEWRETKDYFWQILSEKYPDYYRVRYGELLTGKQLNARIDNEIKILIQKNIALEVCPYSNYITQAFKDYQSHPLKKLLELNVPVTINSDDPGIFSSTLSDDYYLAQTYQNFSLFDFKKCIRTAYEQSFLKEEDKLKVKEFYM